MRVIKHKIQLANTQKEQKNVFQQTENYLSEHYDFRFNTISLEIESCPKDSSSFEPCNESALWVEVRKEGIPISQSGLIAILKSDFPKKHNPLLSYFESLPNWDGKVDYIKKFASYVKLTNDEKYQIFENQLKKWLVRVVKCAIIPDYFNKQAFILSDEGKGQNIGKSSWCRFLCPPSLSNYIAEDLSGDKDSRILLCKNFLINLEELSVLSRKDVNGLKALFSKTQINERLPYDKKNSIIPRVASFIGSTNMSTFLQDETGSVRWLCFSVESIDWSYRTKFNIDNLWSQAYHLSKDQSFNEVMTPNEIAINEQRNDKYKVVSAEEDMISRFFEIESNEIDLEFLTATDILNHINIHTSRVQMHPVGIGKALTKLGAERKKHEGRYGYWLKKRDVDKLL